MEELTKQVNKLIKKNNDRSKTERGGRRDGPVDATEPTSSFGQRLQFDQRRRTETKDEEKKEIVGEGETEKNHDFFPTEKSIAKRKKVRYTATRIKYSPTRVKSRNFLSNISYNSINKADFYNENFILDVFILLVTNLNPFSLQHKISDKFKHEMIYMLWRECIPPAFYRFICQEDNFRYLNRRDVSQPGVLEIVGKFVDQDKNNLRLLQQCLANYKDIFQYVYSCTYPEIYTMSERRGIDMKSNFYILFKTFKDKMMIKQQQLAKQAENFEAERNEELEFEQKPVLKFNEFDGEEKEIKEQQREKNRKRKHVSDEERLVKLQKKTVNNKEKEKQMWEKLDELNKKFKDIKKHERAGEKKMSATIV